MNQLDDPSLQDNRNYDYTGFSMAERPEYDIITSLIEPGSKIIDLGCGNGTLLKKLIAEQGTEGSGIEISDSGVKICKDKGLNVIKAKIDSVLPFEDNYFDYSVCNVTIQMVDYPEVLLREMKRISRHQIISFPNFAYYKNRIELLFKGSMPEKMLFGYKWYNTGHIHQLSNKDFYNLLGVIGGLKVSDRIGLPSGSKMLDIAARILPGLFTYIVIFKTTKC